VTKKKLSEGISGGELAKNGVNSYRISYFRQQRKTKVAYSGRLKNDHQKYLSDKSNIFPKQVIRIFGPIKFSFFRPHKLSAKSPPMRLMPVLSTIGALRDTLTYLFSCVGDS